LPKNKIAPISYWHRFYKKRLTKYFYIIKLNIMKYKIIIFIVLFSLFSFYCNWYNEELRIEKNITITINNKSDYNVDCTIIYPYY